MSINLIKKVKPTIYAEVGIFKGQTVEKVCSVLPEGSIVHLFDFTSKVKSVEDRIKEKFGDKIIVKAHNVDKPPGNGNTKEDIHKIDTFRTNYCWNLINLVNTIKEEDKFDYVYLDGSHDLTIDGFAFLLLDKLLKVNGYIEFDDYNWTFNKQHDNESNNRYLNMYTKKQINTPHIKIIVDKLVKNNPNYISIETNRIYKKIK